MHFVYMAQNGFGKLYVGISEDTTRRIHYHNTNQGARFTKSKAEFWIVFEERYNSLAEARQREIQIKKWRREKKEILIERFRKGLLTKPLVHP